MRCYKNVTPRCLTPALKRERLISHKKNQDVATLLIKSLLTPGKVWAVCNIKDNLAFHFHRVPNDPGFRFQTISSVKIPLLIQSTGTGYSFQKSISLQKTSSNEGMFLHNRTLDYGKSRLYK